MDLNWISKFFFIGLGLIVFGMLLLLVGVVVGAFDAVVGVAIVVIAFMQFFGFGVDE